MSRIRRFLGWLRPLMPYVNIILAGAAYWANEYWVQGFCQPVEWAAWVLAVSTAAFLLWPFAKGVPALNYLLLFLMGVNFTVCVYCALFINPVQLLSMLLFFFLLFPLLLWVPVVFAVQALKRTFGCPLPGTRWIFGAGAMLLILPQLWVEKQFREIEAAVASLPAAERRKPSVLARVVPRSYAAERLAGAYFKYHNYPEFILDGWRPPLHDPLINVSLWAREASAYGPNPLKVFYWDAATDASHGSLKTQALFYHLLFPNRPVKADCICNQTYDGEGYFFWEPQWNSPIASRRVQEELAKQEMMRKSKGTFRTHFPQVDSTARLK